MIIVVRLNQNRETSLLAHYLGQSNNKRESRLPWPEMAQMPSGWHMDCYCYVWYSDGWCGSWLPHYRSDSAEHVETLQSRRPRTVASPRFLPGRMWGNVLAWRPRLDRRRCCCRWSRSATLHLAVKSITPQERGCGFLTASLLLLYCQPALSTNLRKSGMSDGRRICGRFWSR